MRIIDTVRLLCLATLLLLPACDKADTKADAKADAKTADAKTDDAKTDDAKADAKTDEATAEHAAHDAAKPEVVEVAADARVEIEVDAGGYHPAEIHAPAKANITLAFKRTTDKGCGQKVVVKLAEAVEKDLPLDEVVEIPVTVPETGELGFACGMDMYKGKVVAKS